MTKKSRYLSLSCVDFDLIFCLTQLYDYNAKSQNSPLITRDYYKKRGSKYISGAQIIFILSYSLFFALLSQIFESIS